MTKYLSHANGFLWGAPSLLLILSVGLYFSFRLRFVQLRLLPEALRHFFAGMKSGESGFRSACTALGATVGTGNLIGVAGAISLGGPGAIFWMWLCGLIGMATKYAEATLAVRYRSVSEYGILGGPMYIMEQGLGKSWKPLAFAYSLFGLLASFGVGSGAQINAVVSGINYALSGIGREISVPGKQILGLAFGTLTGTLLLGGAKRIGQAAQTLVPVAAAGYILLCSGSLLKNAGEIPRALESIVTGAFSPKAVTGGMLGSTYQALRIGCSRGVFTNEAGMGTAAIAHASAEVSQPARQGMMGIVEVFLDTIVICTLTALVILTSGIPIPYGVDGGAELTGCAFAVVYGKYAVFFLALALSLFAVAAIIGWGLYGGQCARYLFGSGAWKPYALAQTLAVVLGASADAGAVWQLSELFNGLMVIPNLITLAALSPEVARLTKEYRKSGI